MASDTQAPSKKREKVVLKQGFGLADWMHLTQSNIDLSGRQGKPMRAISIEELKQHNTSFDCWTVYKGKVYNISQYMHYHPGGIPKIMLGAGQDCTELFDKYHRWVNIDAMLGKCIVGTLSMETISIPEEDEETDLNIDNLLVTAANELSTEEDEITPLKTNL